MPLAYFFNSRFTIRFWIGIWIVYSRLPFACCRNKNSFCSVRNIHWIVTALQDKDNFAAAIFFSQSHHLFCQHQISRRRESERCDRVIPMSIEANRNQQHLWFE